MNIRQEPSLEAEVVTVYPMNTIVEVLEVCDNWLKIKCPEAEDGIAYVLNEDDAYVFVGRAVYEVVAGDNLWRIAERKLGSGTRYTDIRELNGLTSNAIRIGMKLLLPDQESNLHYLGPEKSGLFSIGGIFYGIY